MADTATATADPATGLRALALRYGLKAAGERPGLAEYSRRLWSYRHFITSYADAKLVAAFDNARLGRLWQVLTPLTNAAVYYLLFGVLLNTRAGVPNFVGYLCIGLFVFNFTQTVVLSGLQSITSNLGLIRALHFPRACLPIAAMLTQLQHMIASIVVLAAIVLLTGEPVTVQWVLVVPALLLQSVFNAGLALVMARLGAKIADLKQVMPFVIRTWMYGSGVLYSVRNFTDHLPSALATLVRINPLLVYIELVRDALLDSPPLASTSQQLWLLALAWAALVGFGGYVYFWLGEQEYGRG
jgi:teichoic acid transport system permease protein